MKSLIASLLSFFLISNAFAALGDTRDAELATADKELNEVYQKIMKSIATADKEKLKDSQRAWIKFRDLDCKWAFSNSPFDCEIDRTTERTKSLQNTSFTDTKGDYRSVETKTK